MSTASKQKQPMLQFVPMNTLFVIKRGLSDIRVVAGRKHVFLIPGLDKVIIKLPLGPQRTHVSVSRLNTSGHDNIRNITALVEYHLDKEGWKHLLRNIPNRAVLYNEAGTRLGLKSSEMMLNFACHEQVFASLVKQEFDRILREIVSSDPRYAMDIEQSRKFHQSGKVGGWTRHELTEVVMAALQESLARYGLVVDNVSITDIDLNNNEMRQNARNKLIQAQCAADTEKMKLEAAGEARNTRIVDLYARLKEIDPNTTTQDVMQLIGMEQMGPAYALYMQSMMMGQNRRQPLLYDIMDMDKVVPHNGNGHHANGNGNGNGNGYHTNGNGYHTNGNGNGNGNGRKEEMI